MPCDRKETQNTRKRHSWQWGARSVCRRQMSTKNLLAATTVQTLRQLAHICTGIHIPTSCTCMYCMSVVLAHLFTYFIYYLFFIGWKLGISFQIKYLREEGNYSLKKDRPTEMKINLRRQLFLQNINLNYKIRNGVIIMSSYGNQK